MLLKERNNGHLVDIQNLLDLMNLNRPEVLGRYQEGEEQQDPEIFKKADLVFLSGEKLPRCWTDPHYRDAELIH